jgi:hypothetical protein
LQRMMVIVRHPEGLDQRQVECARSRTHERVARRSRPPITARPKGAARGPLVATFATLTILPSIYAILQGRASATSPSLNPMDPASRYYDAT